MRRLASIALAVGIALSACGAEVSTPTPPYTPTPTPTAAPTTAPAPTSTPTPTMIPAAQADEPAVDPPIVEGYAFKFDVPYAGDATVTGNAYTCGDVRGLWHLEVAVSGSPETGVTLETTGAVDFTVPADAYLVETNIPTTGSGTFDYGDGVGKGTVNDPLLFNFELAPDNRSAAVTVTSTGDGSVTMHLPDGDITTKFATVFMADPTFAVDLVAYDGCP